MQQKTIRLHLWFRLITRPKFYRPFYSFMLLLGLAKKSRKVESPQDPPWLGWEIPGLIGDEGQIKDILYPSRDGAKMGRVSPPQPLPHLDLSPTTYIHSRSLSLPPSILGNSLPRPRQGQIPPKRTGNPTHPAPVLQKHLDLWPIYHLSPKPSKEEHKVQNFTLEATKKFVVWS